MECLYNVNYFVHPICIPYLFVGTNSKNTMESEWKKFRATGHGNGAYHIVNDIFASLWFAELLLYYQKIMKPGSMNAGLILLVGQLSNGIAIVVVGTLYHKKIDMKGCVKYGKRKAFMQIFKNIYIRVFEIS